MPRALKLQSWVSLTGASSAVITQDPSDWLMARHCGAVACYLEVAAATAPATTPLFLDIQTSPTPDDSLWNAQFGSGGYLFRYALDSTAVAPSTQVQAVQMVTFGTPTPRDQLPAQYYRWKVTFPTGGPTTVTFRIWISVLRLHAG